MIFFKNQTVPFIIFMLGRSGSSYLTERLDDHPDVRAIGEKIAMIRNNDGSSDDQLVWTRAILKPPIIGKHKAFGFKTKLADILDPPAFADLLYELNIRIIIMQRRNLVKQTISWLNAESLYSKQKVWNVRNQEDKLAPLMVEPESFTRILDHILSRRVGLDAFIAELNLQKFPVFYEDLFEDGSEVIFKNLFEFLDVSPKSTTSTLIKHTNDDLSRAVANFYELREIYEGTEYQAMFDEGLQNGG